MTEIKIALVGGGAVGKSSVTIRHIENKFNPDQFYDPTIEDSYLKQENVDGSTFFVDILDTAGQEEYHSLRDVCLRSRDGFILVYDICNRKSLEEISKFVTLAKRAKDTDYIPMVLIGNKCDMESERQISTVQGKNFAELLGISHFYETSAKSGKNIKESFHTIIRETNQYLIKKSLDRKPKKQIKKQKKCTIM